MDRESVSRPNRSWPIPLAQALFLVERAQPRGSIFEIAAALLGRGEPSYPRRASLREAPYIIARVDVTNPEAYARYAADAIKAIAAHGGGVLVRGGRNEALEGKARARNVVLEFDSYETARAHFHSAEYQAARAIRQVAAEIEMVPVEGV